MTTILHFLVSHVEYMVAIDACDGAIHLSLQIIIAKNSEYVSFESLKISFTKILIGGTHLNQHLVNRIVSLHQRHLDCIKLRI